MSDRIRTPAGRTVMWFRFADAASMEQASLRPLPDGREIAGTLMTVHDGAPFRADYRVRCDAAWRTRSVEITAMLGASPRQVELIADGDGHWRVNGEAAPHLDGCTDVDLEETPATNALPINRLALDVGQTAEVLAAWVRFPALSVELARQTYTRIAVRAYRFRLGDFEARIDVDADGVVTTYEGLWRRLAESAAAG